MPATKEQMLRQLQQEILLMQGYRRPAAGAVDIGLGPVAQAFPNGVFPTGCLHEFISGGEGPAAVSGGFVAGILGALMRAGGVCVWVGRTVRLFPPALAALGVEAHRIIFVDIKRDREALWCMEELLGCEGLVAVVGEIREISFLASRKLQLAMEKSRVTGFLLRQNPGKLETIARAARWQITSLPGEPVAPGMPGLGYPRWRVELLEVRNGIRGSWVMEWRAGRFHPIPMPESARMVVQERRAG